MDFAGWDFGSYFWFFIAVLPFLLVPLGTAGLWAHSVVTSRVARAEALSVFLIGVPLLAACYLTGHFAFQLALAIWPNGWWPVLGFGLSLAAFAAEAWAVVWIIGPPNNRLWHRFRARRR